MHARLKFQFRHHKAALLLALMLASAACGGGSEQAEGDATAPANQATSPEAQSDADASGEQENEGAAGLVIDGHQIADDELWSAAQEEGSLTLYTSNNESTEDAIESAFVEATGLRINRIQSVPGTILERVLSEHGAGSVAADVIAMSGIAYMMDTKQAGVLAEFCSPFFENVPEETTDPDCAFAPRTINYIGFSVNDAVLEAEGLDIPEDWDDLTDPQYRGLIGTSHIGVGGASWATWYTLRDYFGVDYWEALAGQNMVFGSAAAATTEGVGRGELAIGITSPASVNAAIADGAPLRFNVPSVLPVFHHYIALADGAPSPNAGKVFINWMLSPLGQDVLAEVGNEAPADRAVEAGGQEAELAFVEGDSDFVELFEPWRDEWFEIFDYTP